MTAATIRSRSASFQPTRQLRKAPLSSAPTGEFSNSRKKRADRAPTLRTQGFTLQARNYSRTLRRRFPAMGCSISAMTSFRGWCRIWPHTESRNFLWTSAHRKTTSTARRTGLGCKGEMERVAVSTVPGPRVEKNRRSAIVAVALAVASTCLSLLALEGAFRLFALRLPLGFYKFLPEDVKILAQSSKRDEVPRDYIAILGDSYAAGQGDWYDEAVQQEPFGKPPFQSTHVIHQ